MNHLETTCLQTCEYQYWTVGEYHSIIYWPVHVTVNIMSRLIVIPHPTLHDIKNVTITELDVYMIVP